MTNKDIYVDYVEEGQNDEVKLRFNFDINPPQTDKLFEQRARRRLNKLNKEYKQVTQINVR